MTKKVVQNQQQAQKTPSSTENAINPKAVANFSISHKSYVKFFQFLKELHASQGHEKQCQINSASSLIDITTSIMNFFNYEKTYSSKQLECSIICLANLFNVIGNNISKLHFEAQFMYKVRRYLKSQVSDVQQDGFQQKIQAILYILTVLIYKQRSRQEKRIRDLNKRIFKDRVIIHSLLNLKIPLQKKIGKFYGIVIIYLTSKNVNSGIKKKIVKSILLNFCYIDHEQTLINLLVYLRSEKNKVTISLKDVQQGKIFEILLSAHPRHINSYQSYYILDYLHHLLLLFPILAQSAADSQIWPYLLQNAGLENLFHPLHLSIILDFTQKTLEYLEPLQQHKLLQEIIQTEIKQQRIIRKIGQLILDLQENAQNIFKLALKGLFNKLLKVIRQNRQEFIRTPAIQLYLAVNQKLKTYNEEFSDLITYRLRMIIELFPEDKKQKYLQILHSKIQTSTQQII